MSGREILHVVDIDADRDTVRAALTEQDRMASWWTTDVQAPDAEVGTVVRWRFVDGFNPEMEITANETESVRWRCVRGAEPWTGSEFRFDLAGRPDGDGTRLRFRQGYAAEIDDDAYGIFNYNWAYYLESLRLLCSTGAGKPFRAPADEG